MANEPATIWKSPTGQYEFTPSGNPAIDTEAGLDLLTEAGLTLVTEDSTATPTPPTVWQSDDGDA